MPRKPKENSGEPPVDEARAGRMFDALTGLELRERRRLTLEELGERIAAAEGREVPYSGSVVRRWFKGLSEPGSLALWRAIGAVLGERPGWLAFGEAPAVAPAGSLLDVADRAAAEAERQDPYAPRGETLSASRLTPAQTEQEEKDAARRKPARRQQRRG